MTFSVLHKFQEKAFCGHFLIQAGDYMPNQRVIKGNASVNILRGILLNVSFTDSYEKEAAACGKKKILSSSISPPLEIEVTEEQRRFLRLVMTTSSQFLGMVLLTRKISIYCWVTMKLKRKAVDSFLSSAQLALSVLRETDMLLRHIVTTSQDKTLECAISVPLQCALISLGK